MSTELLRRASKALAAFAFASSLILIKAVDIGWMLACDLLKFILLADKIPSSFFGNISAAELIVADPDDGLFPALKRHLLHSIGDVKPVAYSPVKPFAI